MVANKDQFATYSFLPITAKTLGWANEKLPSASRFCKFKHFKKYVFFLAFEKCGFQIITTTSTVKMLKFIYRLITIRHTFMEGALSGLIASPSQLS